MASNRVAVVYTVPRRVHGGPGPGATREGVAVFGCLIGVWRRVELGTAPDVERVALAGAVVAYVTTQVMGIDTSQTRVFVADIRDAGRRFNVPAGQVAIAPSSVQVDALRVTPQSTVAWVQHGGRTQAPGSSVHAASASKPSDHRLASGAIDPRSLRLRGSTVSWTQAGQRHSAQI